MKIEADQKVLIRSGGKESPFKKQSFQTYIFVSFAVIPAFVAYLLFCLYPNILSVWYSFLQWDGFSEKVFVGLDNYKLMFQDTFVASALYHNLILILFVPALVIIISLVLADILVNKAFKENSFYKVLFFLPNILSTIVVSLLWCFVYDGNFGILNSLLKLAGINIGQFYWLGNAQTALYCIIPVYVWSNVGFYVILLMNAMSSIPKSYYEYATLEGAGSMAKLFRITLPMIFPIVKVSLIFLMLSTIKSFDIIMVLTGGGPAGASEVAGLYMFRMAFRTGLDTGSRFQYGYASTIGMLLFVILVTAKLVIDKFFPNESVEY